MKVARNDTLNLNLSRIIHEHFCCTRPTLRVETQPILRSGEGSGELLVVRFVLSGTTLRKLETRNLKPEPFSMLLGMPFRKKLPRIMRVRAVP